METEIGSTAVRPKRGLYYTLEHIHNAKTNMEAFPWARRTFEQWQRECDAFLGLTEDQVYDCILGMQGETFAYGISGCPMCGKPMPMMPWEQKEKGMFSAISELPAKRVTCPECATVFPNSEFPDEGEGIEVNGKGYYLIGMWNFFYGGELLGGVRDHEGLVTKLTYLYMLTGERRYAERALVILDGFSAINPGTIGPRDFTPFGSDFEIGRLHLLTSIVHRIKVHLAQDYDWLYHLSDVLDGESPALRRLGQQGTMRGSIERMLNDYMLTEPGGPHYDLKDGNLTNLQNHETDGIRAMLAVGLVLGNEAYCEWGRNAVEACFFNSIGRDGMYYEGSFGYSLFTGSVFLDIALLAMRAMEGLDTGMVNPFENDRFFRFAVENPLAIMCQGHLPSYGDWGRDSSIGLEADPKLIGEAYRSALYFYQFTPSAELRRKAEDVLTRLYQMVQDTLGGRGADLFFLHPGDTCGKPFERPKDGTFMGQAGIGIVRGAGEATLLMRSGPNLTHCHDDVLAYTFYDCGREISADIGYGIYGTNAHYGWGSKAIAHNTVVVNRDETMGFGQMYKPFGGGEFELLYESAAVKAIEGQANQLFGIESYRRMLGMAALDESSSYVVDFFHVAGAETADYAFHAFHEASVLELTGAKPHPSRRHWTLAGVDAEVKPYFDEPGKSFGERLTTGETFTHLLEGEEPRLWTDRINNGYGFIYDVKEYEPDQGGVVKAVWKTDGGSVMNWCGLAEDGERLFTGWCPSLEGTQKHPILVQRSRSAEKTFSAVSFASSPERKAHRLEVRRLAAPGRQVTALEIKLPSGAADYWVYSPYEQEISVEAGGRTWSIFGRCAWMRVGADGSVLDYAALSARSLQYATYRVAGPGGEWAEVVRMEEESGAVWVRPAAEESGPPKVGLPGRSSSSYIRIRKAAGGPSSLYPVLTAEPDGDMVKLTLRDSFVLSRGIVSRVDGNIVETMYPLPLGVQGSPDAASPFAGKTVRGQLGGLAVVEGIPSLKQLAVHTRKPFSIGEKFEILDLQPGDLMQWL